MALVSTNYEVVFVDVQINRGFPPTSTTTKDYVLQRIRARL
jgi:hypothetical protein